MNKEKVLYILKPLLEDISEFAEKAEMLIEFLEDGFGEDVMEIGYLCFITLF